jgi:DNA invertase Pin-like site-specific DNA recombinase
MHMARRDLVIRPTSQAAPLKRIRAAEYVRMSTEHQKFSIENQSAAIAAFAQSHNIEIVRTYADAGRSGLDIKGRPGLQALINDIESGFVGFSLILVYDISRWGRFQNTDEAAYYEYLCARAGILIEYCAEPFPNDGSLGSSILKSIKRVMAAEYSRELSVKSFAGKRRLAELGFRQGGPVGFALRRQLIDQYGQIKGFLESGDRKCIATDRVVLVPGSDADQRVVRWMYKSFANGRWNFKRMARHLNQNGTPNHVERPWTRTLVREILTNEKYIGNNVINRFSLKLRSKMVRNPEADWIRAEKCFQPIVSKRLFDRVQKVIVDKRTYYTDKGLLEGLAELKATQGRLSLRIIDGAVGMANGSTYQRRFGSLANAYRQIGYSVKTDRRYLEFRGHFSFLKETIAHQLQQQIQVSGRTCNCLKSSRVLVIDGECSLRILVRQCRHTDAGFEWHIFWHSIRVTDLALIVRMAPNNVDILDYFLLRRADRLRGVLILKESNTPALAQHHLDSIPAVVEALEHSCHQRPELYPSSE